MVIDTVDLIINRPDPDDVAKLAFANAKSLKLLLNIIRQHVDNSDVLEGAISVLWNLSTNGKNNFYHKWCTHIIFLLQTQTSS